MNGRLPQEILELIEDYIGCFSIEDLQSYAKDLSTRYRGGVKGNYINKSLHRAAYLSVRLPATYAVICRVLREVKDLYPGLTASSLVDFGAGPGPVSWAVNKMFPMLEKITNIETDVEMTSIGKRLFKKSEWLVANVEDDLGDLRADFVTSSYMLGELKQDIIENLLFKMYHISSKLVILIEPGTPSGFERILFARESLIKMGMHVVAPCPHSMKCPMSNGDWCHFSQRLFRTHSHRLIKEVDRGFEDEKYSYIVLSKVPTATCSNRILMPPQKKKGHLHLKLCNENGIENRIISKKEKSNYIEARKKLWGDSF